MMTRQIVSIRDVAKRAQVSTATVSNVINSTAYVSPELRRRVLAAIQEVGYQPSAVARSLRTKQTRTAGMVIPDITNPFFADVVRGAEDLLLLEGYTLIIGNSDGETRKEEQYYRTFCAKQVDGMLIVVALADQAPQYLRHHNYDDVPIVYLDRLYRGLRGDAVLADNIGGSYQAVCHLFDHGHRRVAIITGPRQFLNARQRLEGYKRALAHYHLEIDNELIGEGRFDIRSGYDQTKALLNLRDRPTGLFVSNALMTMGSLRALSECRVRWPEDIALVSFDDLEWFDLARPSISAVAQPAYDLGAKAAEMLLKRFSGHLTGSPNRKVLKTRLVVRDSSNWRHETAEKNNHLSALPDPQS
jgi:DNA-binding LacI/PurR family transcriptional regulator